MKKTAENVQSSALAIPCLHVTRCRLPRQRQPQIYRRAPLFPQPCPTSFATSLGNHLIEERTKARLPMPYETTAWAGPLTTIWPDGQHCVQTYTSAAGEGWAATYSVFFGHWGSYKAARTCYPPAVVGTAVDVGSNYYFSPGVCPSGYATACAYTGHTNIPTTVTASVCCPRYVRPSRPDCHQIRLGGGQSNCRPNNPVDSAASTDGQCK